MTTCCSGTGFALRAAIFKSITLENTGLHSNEMITPSLLIGGIESGRPVKIGKEKELQCKDTKLTQRAKKGELKMDKGLGEIEQKN